MKTIALLLLAGLSTLASTPHSITAQSISDDALIDSFIAKQAKKSNADEFKDAREIVRGDLNGDTKPDLVVLYTLEGFGGSNNYTQYLAVFLNRSDKLVYTTHQAIGGKNRRSIASLSIANQEIKLQTLGYLSTDASCCPSRKRTARLVLRGGRLRELSLGTRV